MGHDDIRNRYRVLARQPGEERNHFGGLGVDGMIILKYTLRK
jgi:hypothetical protein